MSSPFSKLNKVGSPPHFETNDRAFATSLSKVSIGSRSFGFPCGRDLEKAFAFRADRTLSTAWLGDYCERLPVAFEKAVRARERVVTAQAGQAVFVEFEFELRPLQFAQAVMQYTD
jgi:hypothetical protein